MLLRWDDREVHVNNTEDLDGHLDEIAARDSDPVLVSVHGTAGILSLGMGHPSGGLLLFLPSDSSAMPLHSLGDSEAHDGQVQFRSGANTVDFFPRCLVPHDVMRAAARSFLVTGRLPEEVTWEPEPSPAVHD
ncbi:hypothetical protein KL864_29200 [Mycolicibacterium goodii]|uniref:Imm1 family immunity protein n=1 Tax=Mycolicibacterium goodii TaxID=134601 RepID=UPI000C2579BE|nr:Imm1 family immunity protein [Mycolicibacterium goodii]MBU8819967.1 hypothetical protein [Mycolicibacterium goodii]PJK21451.1 hypothetical protein CSX11_15745 [Mycolicibacterium goodii]